MAVDKNSVSYMKDYLSHAVVFEKNVYIWSHAMEEINNRMRHLYSERAYLEAEKTSVNKALSTLDSSNNATKIKKEKDILKYKKRSKTSIVTMFITLLILFVIGCGIGLPLLNNTNSTFAIAKVMIVPLLGFAVMIIGALFTGIVPICIIVFFYSKIKFKNLETELKSYSNNTSLERQRIILQTQEDEKENDLIVNTIEESLINKKQEEIHTQLQIANKNLNQIYSLNILPAKYRNLNAVATLFEYLNTGRCNTIQGHGGIYDTYETERIQLAQLQQQVQMNMTLSQIEDNQRQICQEIREANHTLSGIKTHLSEIEKTNAEIAHNSAISAAADQQTAAAAQWMAWKTWANGY